MFLISILVLTYFFHYHVVCLMGVFNTVFYQLSVLVYVFVDIFDFIEDQITFYSILVENQ